jgi:hypothetical protein
MRLKGAVKSPPDNGNLNPKINERLAEWLNCHLPSAMAFE